MSDPGPIIVGFCGKARAGKSTVADALVLHRGCHRIALADPIRSALSDLGMPGGEILKELTPDLNYRRAMQILGTECRDEVNAPGLWVHLLLAKVRYLTTYHPALRTRFVIPDIRFRHEASMIRHQVNVWHGRCGIMQLTREGVGIIESRHVSETEPDLVGCNRCFANDGTVSDLIQASCLFFDDVREGRYASYP